MTREHPQHADPDTYLGIDVGTSATKAVVIAPDGTVLARSRVPHPAARGRRARAGQSRGVESKHHRSGPRPRPRTPRPSAVSAWTPTAPPPCCSTRPVSRSPPVSPGITPGWPNRPTAHRRVDSGRSAPGRQPPDAGHRDGRRAPAAANHRTPSRRRRSHLRLRQHLAGALAHRRTRDRPHPGLLHRPDGQHRRILPVARRRPGPVGHPAAAAAAGASVAQRARRAATGDRRHAAPAARDPGAGRIRRHPRRLLRVGHPTRRPAAADHGNHPRGVQRPGCPRPPGQRAATRRRARRPMADQRCHQRRRCPRATVRNVSATATATWR